MIKDRIRDRFQIEIGIRFDLVPQSRDSWLQWAFSPSFGLTRVGQVLEPGRIRQQVPEGTLQVSVDCEDLDRDPETNLMRSRWTSRCFWLRGAIRILGVDLGAGIFWRRKFDG